VTPSTGAPRPDPRDPATGEPLGEFPPSSPEEIRRAVQNARAAFPAWAALPPRERAAALGPLRERLDRRAEALAQTIARSTGKPLVEAYSSELIPVAHLLRYFLRRAPTLLAPRRRRLGILDWTGRRSFVERRPAGVVAVLSPWNYPFSIPAGDAILALLAGCTVVLKPSERAPLVGRALEEFFEGLPPGVFSVVQGGPEAGAALVEAGPDRVVFTGGAAGGRQVLAAAARRLIPCTLELGGKDPMIVLADAPLELAADAAVWGCFTNAGQVCASVKRVYVEHAVAGRFLDLVVRATRALRVGDPLDPGTDVGALLSEAHLERVRDQIAQAVGAGARLRAGGRRVDRPGFFLEPCVLEVEDPSAAILREEVFGPVLPVCRVSDADEAVLRANDSPFGLTASVWTRNLARGRALAARLQAGTVLINECTYAHALAEAPWGGVKESGFGRTRGHEGLLEFTQAVHVHENRNLRARSPWWFPYDAALAEGLRATLRFYAEGGLRALVRLLRRFPFSRLKPPSEEARAED
jgi:acyl-CoA reductase-like NAD-dependent aldehyde dehydrogenase